MAIRKRKHNGAVGFTLIEILTVIGIVSILLAVLLPVVFQAWEKARSASCVSNMRQINIALASYVSDNDGTFPLLGFANNDVAWYEAVSPYMKTERMICPNVVLPGHFANHEGVFKISGYALNTRLNRVTRNADVDELNFVPRGETRLHFPALTVSVFEARAGIIASTIPDIFPWHTAGSWKNEAAEIYLSYYEEEIKQQKGGAERHSGGANYAFADGHVKWLKPEQLSASPTSDGVHLGFGL